MIKFGEKNSNGSNTARLLGGLLIWLFSFFSVVAQDIQQLHIELDQQTDEKQRSRLLRQLGTYYEKEKAYAKALDYYEQAFSVGKPHLSVEEQILLSEQIAGVSELLKKYDKAFEAYHTVLVAQQQLPDSSGQIATLNRLAQLYEKTGDPAQALKIYQQLIQYDQRHNHTKALIQGYNNMALLYYKQEDTKQSLYYFSKVLLFSEPPNAWLSNDELTTLYLNVGADYSALSDYHTAETYLEKGLRLQQANPVKTAEIYTYLAANYLLGRKNSLAIARLEKAITLAERNKENAAADNVLLRSYQLMAQLYEKEDRKAYKRYSELYQQLKEELGKQEQQAQKQHFDRQLSVEKDENRLLNIIAEKQKSDRKNTELENLAKEKELTLTNRELDLLKRDKELHHAQMRNQLLEKEKMAQMIRMAEQRLETENQKRFAIQQQLMAEKIKAENARQQKELLAASKEKALQAQQLQQAETQSKLWFSIILLMLSLLLVSTALYVHSRRTQTALATRNKFIQNQHQEIEEQNVRITKQNEELTYKQEEILLQSDWLQQQNLAISQARQIIENQNEQLKLYTENLEQQVQERTSQLLEANQELMKNNQQLEQFGYIVAHNLRGPVARMLGLTNIFKMPDTTEKERAFVSEAVGKEARVLDGIISDLNIILQVKKGIENEVETISLNDKLANVLTSLQEDISASGVQIQTDFSAANEIDFIQPYLHSILYNLVSNAIKYRCPNRVPVVEMATSRIDQQTICLKVKDNGMGMDLMQHGNNVFGLYKRFHFHTEGKGIGLYLVKTQMESLGGKIELESQVGKGTTFYLYFNNLTIRQLRESMLSA